MHIQQLSYIDKGIGLEWDNENLQQIGDGDEGVRP